MDNHFLLFDFKKACVFCFVSILLAFWQFDLIAQYAQDTFKIEPVEINSENIKRFQAGAKVEKIQPIKLEIMKDGNLASLLSRYMPIAIKSDAGGLSSIRIRGTSPDHTSVNFGGIDLNSLTLGLSNIINIPICLFDEVDIQFGSASAVNGSGSIGGAVHLGLKNQWTNGFKAEFMTAYGSFNEELICTKIYFGNTKWETVTRFYYYNKANSFKFFNTSIKDFVTGEIGVEDVQKNANIENKGILQEFNYRFAPQEWLKIMIWLENDWHYVQQNQASNYYSPDKKETYEDQNIRTWASYDNRKNSIKYHFGGGYVFDNGIYNNTTDPIKTQRIVADSYLEYEKLNSSFKIGLNADRIYPTVYAYDKNLEYEDRVDLFMSYNHQLFKKLRITLNLRQGFVTNFKLPFVPAIGISYLLLYSEKNILKLIGNVAKSYRVPTFNDRYWVPGGNPNLLPEKGMSYELGMHHTYVSMLFESSFKINAYFMDIDNWLLWRNGGSWWYAENVQRVQSKGIEITEELKYTLGRIEMTNSLNYAYTNSRRIESLIATSALDRQLEYVPLHSAVAFVSASFKNVSYSIDGSYTGEQYTDETNGNILMPYFLLNSSISYQFGIKTAHQFRIKAMVNNLLNKNYQSSINYAMPRINYRISLIYNFK